MPDNYGTLVITKTKIALIRTVAIHYNPGHIYMSALGTLRALLTRPYREFRKFKIKIPSQQ